MADRHRLGTLVEHRSSIDPIDPIGGVGRGARDLDFAAPRDPEGLTQAGGIGAARVPLVVVDLGVGREPVTHLAQALLALDSPDHSAQGGVRLEGGRQRRVFGRAELYLPAVERFELRPIVTFLDASEAPVAEKARALGHVPDAVHNLVDSGYHLIFLEFPCVCSATPACLAQTPPAT